VSRKRRTIGLSALGAAAAVALFIQISLKVDLSGQNVVQFAQAQSEKELETKPATAEFAKKKRDLKLKIATLPCFRCHNLVRYRKGKKFPHDQHKEEGVGHCHNCHAFKGHFQATIRKETCEDCH